MISGCINPVSGVWGFLAGAIETGFLWWFLKITVVSREETRFLGVSCGGRETGFLWWILRITVGSEKETRFLGFLGLLAGVEKPGFCGGYVGALGEAHAVRPYGHSPLLFFAKKKPGFLEFLAGVEKPGFCCEYQSYLFFANKKPGFLR